jgi:ElaA protein
MMPGRMPLSPAERLTVRFVPFDALSGADVYTVLALRQRVFVVEQHCAYLDADGLDAAAEHLLMSDGPQLVAYLRVLAPGVRFDTFAIGRVIVSPDRRGEQLGRRVVEEAIRRIAAARGAVALSLSAQAHLHDFYGSLGFVRTSEPYDDDGIPHIDMRREAESG